MESLFTALKFAFRQREAFTQATVLLKQLLNFDIPIRKIGATLMAIIELFSAAFLDTPKTPRGEPLDLTGYELVFSDEFEGDKLDERYWKVRREGKSKGGSYSADQISFKDGNLIITASYDENGKFGPDWYSAELQHKNEFCKGYFEIKCKVYPNSARGIDFWSSFWLTNQNAYNAEISKGGVGACEIDIMECFANAELNLNKPVGPTPAIWCNGMDNDSETIDGRNFGCYYADDPAEKFNTYGLLWTDDEYIWYINGVEAMRSSYGNGACQVPEELIISLGLPGTVGMDKSHTGDYVIDYVKIYQK